MFCSKFHSVPATLASLLADKHVALYGFIFAHTSLDLVRVVPGDRCLVDEDALSDVVVIDEAVSVLDIKPFGVNTRMFKFPSTELKSVVVHPLELNPKLSESGEGVAGSAFSALGSIDEPARFTWCSSSSISLRFRVFAGAPYSSSLSASLSASPSAGSTTMSATARPFKPPGLTRSGCAPGAAR